MNFNSKKNIGFPESLPPGWDRVPSPRETLQAMANGGYFKKWLHRKDGRSVIVSEERQTDGRRWVHASIAHIRKIGYEDLVYLKRHWLGEDVRAIQVFPPRETHVNVHPNCLHLWVCLDGDGLPEFSFMTPMGRQI